jgi:hypothetical protein
MACGSASNVVRAHVTRVVDRHTDELRVPVLAGVDPTDAEGARDRPDPWERRLLEQNERVERVVVDRARVGNEPVVGGKGDHAGDAPVALAAFIGPNRI